VAAAVVLGGGTLFFGWAARRTERPRGSSAPDSLARLSLKVTYQRGVDLAKTGAYARAMPYFRRVLALRGTAWHGHFDVACTLFNTTVERRVQRGRVMPMTRSSWERISAAREALERFDSAERLAPGAHEHAKVADMRARRLANWGLAWEALRDAGAAHALDPSVGGDRPLLVPQTEEP